MMRDEGLWFWPVCDDGFTSASQTLTIRKGQFVKVANIGRWSFLSFPKQEETNVWLRKGEAHIVEISNHVVRVFHSGYSVTDLNGINVVHVWNVLRIILSCSFESPLLQLRPLHRLDLHN